MDQSIRFGCQDATAVEQERLAAEMVDAAFQAVRWQLVQAVVIFLGRPISAVAFFTLELALVALLREFGRQLLEGVVNSLEPSSPELLPRELSFEGVVYRRRNEKTRKANVATLFGGITLWRRGYRDCDGNEGSIFPLEMFLGLAVGVSPGLVDWLGRRLAEAGASQGRVLELLRQECGVRMGVKRLRGCLEHLSSQLSELRQDQQVAHLLETLAIADKSRGNCRPVLAVGRDGITLRGYWNGCFSVATAATVSVYDRAGKRLTTSYLAYAPEPGQATMDQMLTSLLTDVLQQWEEPLPQLAYITDSGDHETSYYEDVLSRMLHPRTDERLAWQRVADFYHVSERVWTMAAALFPDDTRAAHGWAHRMLKALKKPSGASRLLHSAASLFHRRDLTKARAKDFWKAYRYLQQRTRFLRYHDYQARHIPLGSGVTEAACKTIFTQRLKLSGMSWTNTGANNILTLRTILLSKTWKRTFGVYLHNLHPHNMRPYPQIATFSDKTRPETSAA